MNLTMKHCISTVLLLAASLLAGGCTDDELDYDSELNGPEQAGDSPLQFAVDPYTLGTQPDARASEPSPVPEPESADEKKIKDFWLFQFKPDGTELAAPAYYSITADGSTLKDLTTKAYGNLTKNTPMTIYVVANTGDESWGTGLKTLEGVKEQQLSKALPIRAGIDDVIIPMSGQLANVTVTNESRLVVPVTRMYAKVKIKADFAVPKMTTYDVNVTNIPNYCKVTSMVKDIDPETGEPKEVTPPSGTIRVSSAFTSSTVVTDEGTGEKWHVLYIPENICGESKDADKTPGQIKNIPTNALAVSIRAKCEGRDYYFEMYPGENNKNNFNIRRNRVYRVIADVESAKNQHNPSANCFIVKPNSQVVFEPYNRDEKGGGYKISTYLDPNNIDKKIDHLEIIWQTYNCIGNNSDPNNPRVWITPNTEDPINSEITVLTGDEGNALVGAYNSSGVIIWSWHIWVTPNEPDNLGNAIVYTTYRWDKGKPTSDWLGNVYYSGKIYYDEPRIPGYAVMPCNLGALEFTAPNESLDFHSTTFENGNAISSKQTKTFGMLYQWGRKDPFPPVITYTGNEDANGFVDYDNAHTDTHYKNDNSTIVNKTSTVEDEEGTTYLFRSKIGYNLSDNNSGIKYAISHPTVYITGTYNLDNGGETYRISGGDWLRTSNTTLWGGLTPDNKTQDYYVVDGTARWPNVVMYRNYGSQKSIFDPCPKGWRVPPGDLWLGFTDTGENPQYDYGDSKDDLKGINYCKSESDGRLGMSMYMQANGSGPTSFFPLQGTRIYNGKAKNVGLCGNYHNATCDNKSKTNILHLHKQQNLFKIFEYGTEQYYAKSTAGPIRCVRDSK